jgi:guanine deaminase
MKKNELPTFKVFFGQILNPKSETKCDFFPTGMLVLKHELKTPRFEKGGYKIVYTGNENVQKLNQIIGHHSLQDFYYPEHFILPGFYDLHFHWVQDKVRLMPKESLLQWLSHYTWPAEKKFENRTYCLREAKSFFKRLYRAGTIGGGIFSSTHGHALDIALELAVGDYIAGNVLMTMNSPDYLQQDPARALAMVQKWSLKYKKKYALTPRFAPTTHPHVMKKGAALARRNGSFIQTHLSETINEINYVLSLYRQIPGFEKVKTYTDIYHQCKILGKKTIVAHGIHLSHKEWRLLAKTKTAIAHCPTSNDTVDNWGLESGLFDFKKADHYRVPWALASDIGGGPSFSMLDVMRSFVEQNHEVDITEATYLKALAKSTLASAKILGIHKTAGNLDAGKWANFLLIKKSGKFKKDSVESILKFLCRREKDNHAQSDCGDRAHYPHLIKGTFYRGHQYF